MSSTFQKPLSLQDRNKIVIENMPLAHSIAWRFKRRSPFNMAEDIEQVAMLGLVKAVDHFSPEKGFTFSSYAVPVIRGQIMHWLRDRSGSVRLPRKMQTGQRFQADVDSLDEIVPGAKDVCKIELIEARHADPYFETEIQLLRQSLSPQLQPFFDSILREESTRLQAKRINRAESIVSRRKNQIRKELEYYAN